MPCLVALASALWCGCASEEPSPCSGVEVRLHDRVTTTVTIAWLLDTTVTGDPTESYVELGVDESFGSRIEGIQRDDGAFVATAIGLDPSTEYVFRTGILGDDGTSTCETGWFVTGDIPTDLPLVELSIDDPQEASDGYIVSTLTSTNPRNVILDATGNYVWWGEAGEKGDALGPARLSRDGTAMLSLPGWSSLDLSVEDRSEILRTPLDGSAPTSMAAYDLHHDFVELPDGTIAAIAYDFRQVGDSWIAGDRLIEFAPDGSEREVWSVWLMDDIEPQETEPGMAYDWSHTNAVDYVEDGDYYVLSLRYSSAIVAVERATGKPLWKLGGVDSTHEMLGGDEEDWFRGQHQFQVLDNGILVFDNGDDPSDSSRAVEYAWADDSHIEVGWDYAAKPSTYCYALGDVTRLDNGNTLVTWSTTGVIEEVTPEGDVVRQLRLDLGAGFGYSTWLPSLH